MSSVPIKILILTANPRNSDRLRLDEEVREIETELRQAKYRDAFQLVSEWAVRVNDLARALLDHSPQIVHFSGHGSGEEGLVLEDDSGNLQLVPTSALAKLFQLHRQTVQCVVLNACYSEVQATAIHQHIDCVVGMNKAIGDKAAVQFARSFYQAIAAGRSLQFAYDAACNTLDLAAIPESSIPTLLNRNEAADPFAITAIPTSTSQATPSEAAPKPMAQQSLSFSNVTSGKDLLVIQLSGDNANINQSSTQSTGGNADLEAALSAIAQLKDVIASSTALNPIEKATVDVPVKMLEAELQKPQPDKGLVDQAIAALQKGLDGVVTLAEPVAKVAMLVAKAWVGLP